MPTKVDVGPPPSRPAQAGPRDGENEAPGRAAPETEQRGRSDLDTSHFEKCEQSPFLSRTVTQDLTGEFDPGSERTLAARLTHASRARKGQPR
jgi:hypothetical protein